MHVYNTFYVWMFDHQTDSLWRQYEDATAATVWLTLKHANANSKVNKQASLFFLWSDALK